MVFNLKRQSSRFSPIQYKNFLLILGYIISILLVGGCEKKRACIPKKSIAYIQDSSQIALLQNVALPFSSNLERCYAEGIEIKDEHSEVYNIYFPICSVDFIVLYYKNTMEQYGWILSDEFNASDMIILHFFSVSRTCLVCVYKEPVKKINTKKIMLCVAEKNI